MKNGKIAVVKIEIKSEEIINDGVISYIENLIKHHIGDTIISVNTTQRRKRDRRRKPSTPFPCNLCKWCHNKQCWYEDNFYPEFDTFYEDCFDSGKGKDYNDKIIEEMFRRLTND